MSNTQFRSIVNNSRHFVVCEINQLNMKSAKYVIVLKCYNWLNYRWLQILNREEIVYNLEIMCQLSIKWLKWLKMIIFTLIITISHLKPISVYSEISLDMYNLYNSSSTSNNLLGKLTANYTQTRSLASYIIVCWLAALHAEDTLLFSHQVNMRYFRHSQNELLAWDWIPGVASSERPCRVYFDFSMSGANVQFD